MDKVDVPGAGRGICLVQSTEVSRHCWRKMLRRRHLDAQCGGPWLKKFRWKNAVVQKLRWLEQTMQSVSVNRAGSSSQPDMTLDTGTHRVPLPREEDDQPRTWQIMMDPHGGPASIPASCVSDSGGTTSPNAPSQIQADLVSTCVLTLHQALCLFDCYHLRLDHFLYRILGDHTNLNSIRMASPVLTAAVCTVGALHSKSFGHLFQPCLAEYKRLVAEKMFSRRANADDVRGLCIGAFWLHELSWALIGHGLSPTRRKSQRSTNSRSGTNRLGDQPAQCNIQGSQWQPRSVPPHTLVLPRLRV